IGSITKTMTGVLLADAIARGETTADATLGDVLGVTGGAAGITLAALATQRSGLPRLPANLEPIRTPANPYGDYTVEDLIEALHSVELGPRDFVYSNFGFMTLGAAITSVCGTSASELYSQRIFQPLGMSRAGCPPGEEARLPGYAGSSTTPWWTTNTPGAGGVGASIRDVAAYLRAHIDVPAGTLGEAIDLATTIHAGPPSPMGYGWGHQGGGWFHDGATYGFTSFAAFHRPTRTGVALLGNSGEASILNKVGFETLTAMVNA
ncbi:MAG: hypothetical protein QOF21_564, partial [Actinomycetota bacterium]